MKKTGFFDVIVALPPYLIPQTTTFSCICSLSDNPEFL
jgi:hypothetical protein